MLYLFSTFMWATAENVDNQKLQPSSEMSCNLLQTSKEEISPRYCNPVIPQPKSDQIETLVQELQKEGLGTFEEIYRVLIPPLSYFDKLPNETVAQWFVDGIINEDDWVDRFVELLNTVQRRGLHDTFASEVGKLIINTTCRKVARDFEDFDDELRKLKMHIGNDDVFQKVLGNGLKDYNR